MISRDMPFKQLAQRNPSFVMKDAETWNQWCDRLAEATDWSLWILTFKLTNGANTARDHFEPVLHYNGFWRHMGKQRMYTSDEIMRMDELVSIELIRERFPRGA